MRASMSPNIEEFKKTLRRGKAGYIPIAELGVHPKIKERILNRPVITVKDEIEFWHKAGYDYVKLAPIVDFNPARIGSPGVVEEKVDSAANFNWASEGAGIIGSFEDLKKYVFPSKSDFDYSRFDEAAGSLPEGMGVVGQYGDIFTMTWEMMGFESFSFALFENPDLIKSLNDRLGKLVYSMFEYFAQNELVDVLWYSDDIAYTNGLLMPPDVLDQYFFPWLRKIGDLAKKYNKPLIYHTDGVLWDVFDKIIECGVDTIHPIEPKAMDIKDVKNSVGNSLSVIGNIDVDLLSRGTPEDIRDNVKTNIETVGQDGGYCVGSGNSIPEYVKIENYLAMIEAAKKFGEF